jgi:hypothetical protein
MKGVDPRLSPVEMRRWDPLCVAARVFAGGPALVGEFVVGATGKAEVVDVGDRVGGVRVVVVDFAEIAGHGATGKGAATILGADCRVLHGAAAVRLIRMVRRNQVYNIIVVV